MATRYSTILTTARKRESSVPDRTVVTESESDRGRILFCAAFRRLQQKAQVFSLEPNAAVRSRLTHSLEVSQIGRYIADRITQKLALATDATNDEQIALVTFVENACLMHDIGNPPFGHFGEAAIKKWFMDKGHECIEQACAPLRPNRNGKNDPRVETALADFLEFDGNPQGLRIVSKLQWNKDQFGLNLTYTTLAAYLKYIRMAGEKEDDSHFTKKAGYFSTEKELVNEIRRHFGQTRAQRFPLAYIMEAADDIAYCVSDLEDSIEKELLDQTRALEAIQAEWPKQKAVAASKYAKQLADELSGPDAEKYQRIDAAAEQAIARALTAAVNGYDEHKRQYTFTDFRTALNRAIVDFAAQRYVDHHEKVFSGHLNTLLPPYSAAGSILDTFKAYCRKEVYCHESVQWTELAGYTAIYGMLDHFAILLKCSKQRFEAALEYAPKDGANKEIIIEKKLLKLFPPKYISAYKKAVEDFGSKDLADIEFHEWNARAHLVVDFVSGMTDDFSISTYQTLSGMRF